ncbi:rhamnogalacturonan acetylesterase [Thermophagus xiamenensis]|uniref:Lysophospholipase L1 n=1 Tax=Thermophagus xiamenensis TaxID=385682 RepID=A0A1I2DWM0_9BACT|nr:rhamnogalacturonan acetylesterase [Thermophagus xiamenensis]SFE84966.1 Lysophospholipase L1 [Thermophagus xiamenensis]
MKLFTSVLLLTLVFLMFSCNQDSTIDIWMIGDSTMAAKSSNRHPESGWGVGLADYVTPRARIHNHAANGRSTLSFINEGRWQAVLDSLSKGDYVIIQFGHNDQKPDKKRHTEPFGTFQENIKRFIDESRDKGAYPIVCSSIVRRHFDEEGRLKDTHGDYIIAARDIAGKNNVPYIDMESLTRQLVSELGPENSKAIYTFTETRSDSTHLSVYGAKIVAGLFVKEVKKAGLPLAEYFVDQK